MIFINGFLDLFFFFKHNIKSCLREYLSSWVPFRRKYSKRRKNVGFETDWTEKWPPV